MNLSSVDVVCPFLLPPPSPTLPPPSPFLPPQLPLPHLFFTQIHTTHTHTHTTHTHTHPTCTHTIGSYEWTDFRPSNASLRSMLASFVIHQKSLTRVLFLFSVCVFVVASSLVMFFVLLRFCPFSEFTHILK